MLASAPPGSRLTPGRAPPVIAPSEADRLHLERVVRAGTSSQSESFRAKVILLAAEGRSNHAIAAVLGCNANTVGKWRHQFALHGFRGLRDAPRSGRPPNFAPAQKARVLQKAIEWPRENGIPFSHWDSSALAKLAVSAGILEEIHPTTVWRWLRDADLQPHRFRYWLKSPDPDFDIRMKDVVDTYLAAPERSKRGIATFCMDEKTSIQAKERKRPDRRMQRGVPQRLEFEYIRHGTLCLTAAFNVASGEVRSTITVQRPATVFAAAVREACLSVPDAPEVHIVADQLSTHWHQEVCKVVAELSNVPYDPREHRSGKERKAFLARAGKRVVFHFTPKHASWLNQVEIWFSVLGRKLINRGTFKSLADLESQVREFVAYHNRFLARPYRWTYTGLPCRA